MSFINFSLCLLFISNSFISFSHKKENIKTDTLNYIIAKPNGEWLGSGIGNVKEVFFQYKLHYKFPSNGKYQVEIKHGMRKDTLRGIEDIGIKIENTLNP